MLILKGENMKSDIVNRIMDDDDNSICFCYYHSPVIYGNCIHVDWTEYSLKDLFNVIDSVLTENYYDTFLDYIIVYTNMTEEDLQEFIELIEKNRFIFNCREILITCAEDIKV